MKGCQSHSCLVAKPKGQAVNSGCTCLNEILLEIETCLPSLSRTTARLVAQIVIRKLRRDHEL